MFAHLLFAFILVIIVSLVYWFFFCDTALRKSANTLLQKSAGGFDTSAQQALAKIKCIRAPIATDYFEHGRILQYNVLYDDEIPNGIITEHDRINDHIAGLYIAALNNLVPNHAGNDFIIQQIREFERYEANMRAQPNFTTTLLTTALLAGESSEQQAVADRIVAAKLATTTRADAIVKYFDDSTIYTSNAQNVHESQVNSDLTRIFYKMDQHVNIGDSFNSAREFILSHPNANSGNACIALDKMQSGTPISTFGTTEDVLFASIWSRCSHPKNSKNRTNMQAAVVAALADCVENNILVCTNGRSARILNSLATLDYDPEIAAGGAMTYEAYRNQIYYETKAIIDQEIDRALGSNDPVLQKVGKSYESGSETCEHLDAYSDYKKGIQLLVDNNINTYSSRMTIEDLNKIRYTCHAFAAM